MNTESCPCPVCNSNRCTVVYSDLSDLLQGLPGIFNLVKCRECNQLYLNPRPTVKSIKFYYPSNYESFINYSIDNLGLIKKISIKYGLHKRCRLVSTYQSHGRLLDVGCGTGQFLDAMRKRPGWSVVGIDISPVAIRVAREELKLDVHLGTLESVSFPEASFDVVTMWDVLEHLHDPVRALVVIGRILKPNGVLIIRTPSLDSWDAALFGRSWAGLDPPRHLVVFSRSTLVQVLQQASFEVIAWHPGGGSYPIFLLSLRFAWGIGPRASGVRGWIWRALAHPLAGAAFALPLWVLERAGKGSEMCVVAKRRNYRS